jgi:nucleotide-binding universal stress UspA family protein
MQKILVAIDGSKHADRAFEVAATLAKQLGSQLIIITVLDEPESVDFEGRQVRDNTSLALERNAQNMLSEFVTKGLQNFGLEVEMTVWRGYPSKTIVEVAEQKGATMVVVRSRGAGGIKELMLGSVSHAVAIHSKVPVLIVK